MKPILTALVGDNSDLFLQAIQLYAKQYDAILDMTYGKGTFWGKIDTSEYVLNKNDIDPTRGDFHEDFRHTSFMSETFDCVVLDPPYASRSSHEKSFVGSIYNNREHMLKTVDDVLQFYFDGMLEARRLLKQNGILFLKCMDEISGGKQARNHISIWNSAKEIGFIDEDLFVLVQNHQPVMRHKHQFHARKNNSFLWVFRKV